jgi:hypothetical protein
VRQEPAPGDRPFRYGRGRQGGETDA